VTTPGLAPTPTAAPGPKPLTHPCVRCGAPVPIDVGLCERCNPLGLRDSSASQVHATVIITVLLAFVGLAFIAHFAVSGVGPFSAQVSGVVPDGAGLAITLTVRNDGTSAGQTTCRVVDPFDRNASKGAIIVSPKIDAGQTRTFSQTVLELGSTVRDLTVACSAP
jgi:hypothetical protein